MISFFLEWHQFIQFIFLIIFFLFITNPIYNIFIFMLISIQSFIFLGLFSKEYFFSLILFIIYLGAIAVLFLFVVLVIGNYTFMLKDTKEQLHFFDDSKKNIYSLFFLIFFVDIVWTIFNYFYSWVLYFENSVDLVFFKNYLFCLQQLPIIYEQKVNNLSNFLFLEDNLLTYPSTNIYEGNDFFLLPDTIENVYYLFINCFLKPETFNILESITKTPVDVWCSTLFLRDSALLYVCAFILFTSTVGVIILVINRKQILKISF